MSVCVYKVGGSLLERVDLAERLTRLLRSRDSLPLLVVGGGEPANVVRDWDRIHRLGDEVAHDLAIAACDFNARLLAGLLKRHGVAAGQVCSTRGQAEEAWASGRVPLLDLTRFLAGEETAADRLPRSWCVTSDSIAAWVAARWPAAELVLVKSTGPPANFDWQSAAEAGRVDEAFPEMASRVARIGWFDAAAEGSEVWWV